MDDRSDPFDQGEILAPVIIEDGFHWYILRSEMKVQNLVRSCRKKQLFAQTLHEELVFFRIRLRKHLLPLPGLFRHIAAGSLLYNPYPGWREYLYIRY